MPPEKLSIVVFSGAFTKVHYALCMASAALAIGKPVTLFFTMKATKALMKGDGAPGWHSLDPEEDGADAAAIDRDFALKGVATFEALLEACIELEARIMVCEMGLKAMGIGAKALREDVPVEEGGLVTFLSDASADGAMVFV
ncbi:MAG: hypothetical protein CMM50_03755 [Rhodospirillaceae bacterium]|nr:hypothetical protein [Rhodospirillaceae bacterium]|tara:strand:- start:224 stop:649 length:426 start_codon:yes stop_codon:yes gene_type:complete